MGRSSQVLLSVLLGVVLFVSINIISNLMFRSARLDLTATNQYTLSEGTKNILDSIEEPVRLQFFFSAEMAANYPQIRIYGDRVRDLLLEYASRSGGRLQLEIVDPKPFTEEEDQAVAEGITAIPTDTGESLYFGLVGTNAVDGREVISYFAPEREAFLEYDLTEVIFNLVRIEKPVLGILSTLPLDVGPGGMMAAMQGQSQPFLIYEQLQASFDVRMVEPDADRIDPEITALMVVHPAELTAQTRYAIDQFVLRGGRALVFVDPLSELASTTGPMGQPVGPQSRSELEDLFEAWGVTFDAGQVVGDLGQALRVQTGASSGRPFSDYVVWLGLQKENMNGSDLVSADLNLLQLASAGHLAQKEGASTKFTALMQSTSRSMLYDSETVRQNVDPDELLLSFEPTPQRYTFAARVNGSFSSAFPDGPPAEELNEDSLEVPDPLDEAENEASSEPLPEHLSESSAETSLILFADTDLLDDRFWVQTQNFLGQRIVIPTADNGVFVINAIESLMGSNDLISLRSRGRDDRPLEVINQIRQRAESQFLREQERLELQLQQTEQRLLDLQTQGQDSEDATAALILSEEEEQEIDRFQSLLLDTRKELRSVQRNLRADVEDLQTRVRFVNIALMPFLVAIFALLVASARRRSRAAALKGR